jgi:hypothetical protein
MQVRKVVVSSVMMGALSAAGLGFAGAASASPYHPQPKPPVVSHQKTVTVTKTTTVTGNTNVGNGNNANSASGNAGQINNPQVGFGTNLGVQLPVNASTGNPGSVTSTAGTVKKSWGSSADSNVGTEAGNQKAIQDQSATGNSSYNESHVNTSVGNGNGSSVNIGNS